MASSLKYEDMQGHELELRIMAEVCSSIDTQVINDSWILDIGASRHMANNRDWYSSWTPLQEPVNVVVNNRQQFGSVRECPNQIVLKPNRLKKFET